MHKGIRRNLDRLHILHRPLQRAGHHPARAWAYKEQLRENLERKLINVVRQMLRH